MAELFKAWKPCKEQCWALESVCQVDEEEDKAVFRMENAAGTPVEETFAMADIHRFDPTHAQDLPNIADMNNVHEGPLLDLLRRRYFAENIYTFTGEILISVNPYESIPSKVQLDNGPVATDAGAPPHLYTVAGRALKLLAKFPASEQSIIINGESGAGKTESSKQIIRFLAAQSACSKEEGVFETIQRYLVDTNVLLEQFGNASTVRNDNSSRFGKYIQLGYSAQQELLGAHISYFLLETSRLISRSSKERNYHVFYAICEGLSDEERAEVGGLGSVADYRYLRGHQGCTPAEREGQSWAELKQSLEMIGLEWSQVVRALVAILELGNVVVNECARSNNAADAEDVEVKADDPRSVTTSNILVADIDASQPALARAAALLGVDGETLRRSLLGKLVTTNSARASVQWVELSKAQSEDALNSLAKALYGRLFDWLVQQVNAALSTETAAQRGWADRPRVGTIGILDIYGFEILLQNSLEQLCINFANERLQSQFNGKVFHAEQQRYLAEGVAWQMDSFGVDNTPCIDLIGSRRLGIFSIIDEQSTMLHHAQGVARDEKEDFIRGVEEQLLAKLHRAHHSTKRHPNYEKPKIKGTTFRVKHYAGCVEYDVTGFPKKNLDLLGNDLVSLMQTVQNDFVKTLFRQDTDKLMEEQMEQSWANERRVFQANSNQGQENSALTAELSRRNLRPAPFGAEENEENEAAADNVSVASSSTASTKNLSMSMSRKSFRTYRSNKERTMGQRFRHQLDSLMEILDAGTPHYIRCIKPNESKSRKSFDSRLVLEQLRYIGIMETVRIRKTGFPVRLSFEDFERNFSVLMRSASFEAAAKSTQDRARQLLGRHLEDGDWAVGHKSVFLKDKQVEKLLAAARKLQHSGASKLQALMRSRKVRSSFNAKRSKAVVIQTAVRRLRARRSFERKRAAALKIQEWVRRAERERKESAALKLQCLVRRRAAQRQLQALKERCELERESACVLQRALRCFVARRRARALRDAGKRVARSVLALFRNRLLAQRLAALHQAAGRGDAEELARLVKRAVDKGYAREMNGVRYGRRELSSLLHSAVKSGSLPVVEMLLVPESDAALLSGHLNAFLGRFVDATGNTALHQAAMLGNAGQSLALCTRLLDVVSRAKVYNEELLGGGNGSAGSHKVLKACLYKRRGGSKFLRRLVVLDPTKGVLSYYRGRRASGKPRMQLRLASSAETAIFLKVSDKIENCFEIFSPELKSTDNAAGSIAFKCTGQRELQQWVTALRGVPGVGFNASLPSLGKLEVESWTQASDFVGQSNKKNETAMHLTATHGALESALFLTAIASHKGGLATMSLLHDKDDKGRTPKQRAEKSGNLDISNALDRLQAHLNCQKTDHRTGAKRLSLTPDALLGKAHSGGTYLSLFLDHLVVPLPVQEAGSIVLCISVVNTSRWKLNLSDIVQQDSSEEKTRSGKAVARAPRSLKQQDLVEDQIHFRPLHWSRDEKDSTKIKYGVMWHMQSPLEQVGSDVCVVVQLKRDKQTLGAVYLPFNANTVGTGSLESGQQRLFPCPPVSTKLGFLARTIRSIRFRSSQEKKSVTIFSEEERQTFLQTKVHYTLRSQSALNCF